MKTREEVIEALKPSKYHIFLIIVFSFSVLSVPIILGIIFYIQGKNTNIDVNFEYILQQLKVIRPMLLFFGMGFLIWWFIIFRRLRGNNNLIKAIEDGTAIIESAKISEFLYREHSSQRHIDRGYYILAKNGDQSFSSDFLSTSNTTLYTHDGQKVTPHGENITLSMFINAVKKYKETWSQEETMQQFANDVKEENPEFKDDNYLEHQGQIYHIGDSVEIYLDPEDSKKYYMNF